MDAMQERLCEEIRHYPHLYNPSFKDASQVAKSWREIAQRLGVDERRCRQKWRYLRDNYVKARKRAKARSGDASCSVSRSPLIQMLGWLSPHIKHRETDSNMPSKSQSPPTPGRRRTEDGGRTRLLGGAMMEDTQAYPMQNVMSRPEALRAAVQQRLAAAAEDILKLFEGTMVEYEEQLCQQEKLLDAVFKPEVRLHNLDVQQLLKHEDQVPPEQQDPAELPHIKEEQEELMCTQEEMDTTQVTFTAVIVKSEEEEDEEKPLQLPQLVESRPGEEGAPCGLSSSGLQEHQQEQRQEQQQEHQEVQGEKTLRQHMKIHKGEKPFNSRSHSGEKIFHCSECGKQFKYRSALKVHMKVHTGEKPFGCLECGKQFGHQKHLTEHMRIHTGEKPYSCSICGTKFRQSSHLNSHVRSHTREKQFHCSECGKRFRYHRVLKLHMRIHTGERPFSCSICGTKFRQTSHLNSHLRSHSGEKPFHCSECGKQFKYKNVLNVHMKIHTGEKTFHCLECGKQFGHEKHLTEHMRIHTGENPPAAPSEA